MNSETKKTEIYTPYTSCCGKGKNNVCNICLRMLLEDFSRYDINSYNNYPTDEDIIERFGSDKNRKKNLNRIKKILYKKIVLILKATPRTVIHNYYYDGKLIASFKRMPDNIMYDELLGKFSHRNKSNDYFHTLLILKQVCDKDFKIIRGVYLENCSEKYFGIY